MRVEVRHLKKSFGPTMALDDISFGFGYGDIFGFVGPNGAGKTTTMRIIASIDEPTEGDVYINGISVREYPEKIRSSVGFVPDTLPRHTDITVHEYLDFYAHAYGLKGTQRQRAVEAVEEFTSLMDIKDKLLDSLSKGMKQRVSLGRALIHNPSVLIMDEPAAGLDPRSRVELRELLKLLRAQNKAILISSHILSELTEICNGVVIIEKGRILESGDIGNIMQKGESIRTIIIRALEDQERLRRELLQMPHVQAVRNAGKELHTDISGSEETSSTMLTALIQRGFRIVEYKQYQNNLEDIFMKITKGEVQ
ncbi:MAG: ABC transporter ATP-binding protein [bacterium]